MLVPPTANSEGISQQAVQQGGEYFLGLPSIDAGKRKRYSW